MAASTQPTDQLKSQPAFFMNLEGEITAVVPKFGKVETKDEIRQYAAKLAEEKRTVVDLRRQLKEAKDQRAEAMKSAEKAKKAKKVWVNKHGALSWKLNYENDRKVAELRQRVDRLEKQLKNGAVAECFICCNNFVEVVFHCGHTACRSCAEKLTNCYVCRKDLRQFIHIYKRYVTVRKNKVFI